MHGCEDNIKMDIKAVRWVGMEWIHLDQDRCTYWTAVITVMNI